MKKNRILLTGLFAILFSISTFGQGGGVWNFDWNMGFPMGELKDFTDQPSFRGFSIEGQGYVTDNVTIGGFLGWNVFYENLGYVTIDYGNTTKIYGYERRYLNAMPLLATAHYYFTQSGIQPYIGVGVGTYYIESRDFMGVYYEQGKDWHFGFAPEAGLVLPFGSGNAGMHVGFKYNVAAKTKDEQAYSWLGVNIGISYLF